MAARTLSGIGPVTEEECFSDKGAVTSPGASDNESIIGKLST